MKDAKDCAREELLFCLDLWNKRGACSFGKETKCQNCGAPYLLYKICTGEVIHERRLSYDDWKALVNNIVHD